MPQTRILSQSILCCICLSLCFACDFLTSATDITFGEGSLPLINQETLWPSADELSGLTEEEKQNISGFPESLENSTFSHLSGALAAQGQCQQMAQKPNKSLSAGVKNIDFELTSCTEDDRCHEACMNTKISEDGESSKFLGMKIENYINLTLLTAKQSKELVGQLPNKSADGIVQIRLEFQELEFFQGADAKRENINRYIEDFSLSIAKGSEDLNNLSTHNRNPDLVYIPLLDSLDLPTISPSSHQRYEIDLQSDVGQYLLAQIMAEKEVNIVLRQSYQIPRNYLFSMNVNPAGIQLIVQPEITINAIDVVSSQLSAL